MEARRLPSSLAKLREKRFWLIVGHCVWWVVFVVATIGICEVADYPVLHPLFDGDRSLSWHLQQAFTSGRLLIISNALAASLLVDLYTSKFSSTRLDTGVAWVVYGLNLLGCIYHKVPMALPDANGMMQHDTFGRTAFVGLIATALVVLMGRYRLIQQHQS